MAAFRALYGCCIIFWDKGKATVIANESHIL